MAVTACPCATMATHLSDVFRCDGPHEMRARPYPERSRARVALLAPSQASPPSCVHPCSPPLSNPWTAPGDASHAARLKTAAELAAPLAASMAAPLAASIGGRGTGRATGQRARRPSRTANATEASAAAPKSHRPRFGVSYAGLPLAARMASPAAIRLACEARGPQG